MDGEVSGEKYMRYERCGLRGERGKVQGVRYESIQGLQRGVDREVHQNKKPEGSGERRGNTPSGKIDNLST